MTEPASPLIRLSRRLDLVAIVSGRIVAWLIVPMVLALSYEVVSRYVFNAPTAWAYDMTFMLYGTFFMIGAAWTLQRGGHIRTDTYYANWSPRTRARVDAACYVVFFFPAMMVFLVLTWEYFLKSYGQNERIVTSPWLPIVWPFKFVMPLTALLLLLQGAAEFLRALRTGFGRASR
jgi:TRAP-type mannitol/chloroaromatic compound transport system permease small subunit